MKTVFDKETRDELIKRINSLNENSTAKWGKMNIYQMVKHCSIYDGWLLGEDTPKYKQAFIGKLFGKTVLRSMLKDEKPLKHNMGTLDSLKATDSNGNTFSQKKRWIELIKEFEFFSNPEFVHTFLGKMTKEQIGYLDYKHTDHHLGQFGV